MAHGGGGRLTHQLIEDLFLPAFANDLLAPRHDGAVFPVRESRLAMTTDAYVVQPLLFPGGDIGRLAVFGTVNDLAMCGARPLYLSVAFILEEGLSIDLLRQIVQSMRAAAAETGVQLVTGDTKVVEKGKGDGVFLTTTGVGVIEHDLVIAPDQVRPGDRLLVSGDLGRHGVAIMAARGHLAFETTIESDCAPLVEPIARLLEAGIDLHCLRDLTRGGLASAVVEIAAAGCGQLRLEEATIPVREDVRGACELLGLDPLHLANEGRFLAFLPARQAEDALALLRALPGCSEAALIGEVHPPAHPRVLLRTTIGSTRVLAMMSGEQLPRIC
jgi:hydrogenase expression/formation protein HypE